MALTTGRTAREWQAIHERREPLRTNFGGGKLNLPPLNLTPTIRDAWSRAYQAWCQRTGTEPGPAAIGAFHDVAKGIPHSRCNFC